MNDESKKIYFTVYRRSVSQGSITGKSLKELNLEYPFIVIRQSGNVHITSQIDNSIYIEKKRQYRYDRYARIIRVL